MKIRFKDNKQIIELRPYDLMTFICEKSDSYFINGSNIINNIAIIHFEDNLLSLENNKREIVYEVVVTNLSDEEVHHIELIWNKSNDEFKFNVVTVTEYKQKMWIVNKYDKLE